MFGKTAGLPLSGPMMLLKTMGLDPEEIKNKFDQLQAGAVNVVQNFDMRLQVLEKQQAEILAILKSKE